MPLTILYDWRRRTRFRRRHDFDGDGKPMYRVPSTMAPAILQREWSYRRFGGISTDKPVATVSGDGKTDIAVFTALSTSAKK